MAMAMAMALPRRWVDLPREITAIILQKIGTIEKLLIARRVCTTWRNICKDPAMWRIMVFDIDRARFNKKKLCRHAVDLSQGELIDIEVIAYDGLIDYIAQRSPKLKRLRLIGNCVDSKAVSEAVKKFPLLEEMHLIYSSIQTIKDIASSCPLLTSLTLNAYGREYHPVSESIELAIIFASMPKLRHLKIVGCKMTNEVLIAILNGCSQLESLDLCKCDYFYVDDKLFDRCCRQIKHLKLPNDFIESDQMTHDDLKNAYDMLLKLMRWA